MINYNSLDTIHCEKLINIVNKDNILIKKEKLLLSKQNKLELLRNKISKPKYINNNQDDFEICNLTEEIENLKVKINHLKNKTDDLEYLCNIQNIVNDYYFENQTLYESTWNKIESINNTTLQEKKEKGKKRKKKIFQSADKDYININILTYFNDKKNKRDYYKEYLSVTEYPDYEELQNKIQIFECPDCKIEKTIVPCEGYVICTNCGVVEFIIIENERQKTKESMCEKNGHSYQRINHFKERLSQFDEYCEIPKSIYELLIKELKISGYNDFKALTYPYLKIDLIRKILKKHKLNNYYKYTTHILCIISNTELPKISQELRTILIKMFEMIQEPFLKYKPKSRINFLSYSYIFYKFFELLKLDELKQSFTLLKSIKKLKQQDDVWRKICNELNWPFYHSSNNKNYNITQMTLSDY